MIKSWFGVMGLSIRSPFGACGLIFNSVFPSLFGVTKGLEAQSSGGFRDFYDHEIILLLCGACSFPLIHNCFSQHHDFVLQS